MLPKPKTLPYKFDVGVAGLAALFLLAGVFLRGALRISEDRDAIVSLKATLEAQEHQFSALRDSYDTLNASLQTLKQTMPPAFSGLWPSTQ